MENISDGYCHCGCGAYVGFWSRNDSARGRIKGQPKRFAPSHFTKATPDAVRAYRQEWEDSTDVPYGHCWCGCGRETDIATRTSVSRGRLQGQPMRYVQSHTGRILSGPMYVVEDRDYDTPCWIWQRNTNSWGYGYTTVEGKSYRAHRLFYEREHGSLQEGEELHHLCCEFANGSRRCVRPSHLSPVTHAENGQRGNQAKLTRTQVDEIRRLYSSGVHSIGGLSKRFGVSDTHILRIVRREVWR